MKKDDTRVKLGDADFHRLISKLRHVEVLRLEAREKAAKLVMDEIGGVEKEKQAMWDALSVKYRFDPKMTYTFDEATCELVKPGRE